VGQCRLAHAGQIFNQQMAAGEQAGQCLANLRFFAENDFSGFAEYVGKRMRATRAGSECGSGHGSFLKLQFKRILMLEAAS